MKHTGFLVIGALLLALAATAAQQGSTTAGVSQQQSKTKPDAEQHLQMLSSSLDLTTDQQAKIRPILREYLDTRQKLMDDKALSGAQRDARLKALFEAADKQTRQYLSDDQKTKLDQMERESMATHQSK